MLFHSLPEQFNHQVIQVYFLRYGPEASKPYEVLPERDGYVTRLPCSDFAPVDSGLQGACFDSRMVCTSGLIYLKKMIDSGLARVYPGRRG